MFSEKLVTGVIKTEMLINTIFYPGITSKLLI